MVNYYATLSPKKDITYIDGKYVALSSDPWLQLNFEKSTPEDEWIEIVFESADCEPARPLLRAVTSEGAETWILPAAVIGRAIWYGRAPKGVKQWLISPTNYTGPFSFCLVSVRNISFLQQLILLNRLSSVLMALWLKLRLSSRVLDVHLSRRLLSTPFANYKNWIKRRPQTITGNRADRLQRADINSVHIRFVLLVDTEPRANAFASLFGRGINTSVVTASKGENVIEVLSDLRGTDFVAFVDDKDEWLPCVALANSIVERDPCDVLYFDEEITEPTLQLWLKPAWDPLLARSIDMTGQARLFSVSFLEKFFSEMAASSIPSVSLPVDANLRVRHVARIAMRTPARTPRPRACLPQARGPELTTTVIIPTRDQIELLRKCVFSLQHEAAPFEAIIVDNGSKEASTLQFLQELRADYRFRVLDRPGPFNFSRLCNEAAREAGTQALLLLNNDVEAISTGWLRALTAWTADPIIGAVAPKLLYPDGSLQHAGVILGIEGLAGHFEYGIGADDSGYFGRLNVPFSVSAVTGACLAVSREKFFAVGGLDEENFPVELNDVDFCLRLKERGWRNMVDGSIRLVHHESASRGRARSVRESYPREWANFRSRWMHLLRDDPAFSPGLSLESTRPSLG